MTLELRSPSYTASDIENWVNDNPSNEIAQRIKKKYFDGGSQFNESSKYFIIFTNGGGVLLKRDKKGLVRAS